MFILEVQSCKLYNNKYMIASTQITNTEIFAFIAVLVFDLLTRKAFFINRKDNKNCLSLHERCPNTQIHGVNLRIQSKYRKIRTRNNSVFGHFSRSVKNRLLADFKSKLLEKFKSLDCEKFRTLLKHVGDHLSVLFQKHYFSEYSHLLPPEEVMKTLQKNTCSRLGLY